MNLTLVKKQNLKLTVEECNKLIKELRNITDELSLSILNRFGYRNNQIWNTNKPEGQCLYDTLKKLIEIADKTEWELSTENWEEWIREAKQEIDLKI